MKLDNACGSKTDASLQLSTRDSNDAEESDVGGRLWLEDRRLPAAVDKRLDELKNEDDLDSLTSAAGV